MNWRGKYATERLRFVAALVGSARSALKIGDQRLAHANTRKARSILGDVVAALAPEPAQRARRRR